MHLFPLMYLILYILSKDMHFLVLKRQITFNLSICDATSKKIPNPCFQTLPICVFTKSVSIACTWLIYTQIRTLIIYTI